MATRHRCGLLFWTVLALAPAFAAHTDPPARVARLAQVEGAVGIVPADSESWDEAAPNRPMVTGDRIETGPEGRAAIEFDAGVAYLGGDSTLAWTGLDDGGTRLDLPVGTLRVETDEESGAPVEVRTPTLAFVVDAPGAFRFDVDPGAGVTTVTVYSGSGIAYGADGEEHALTAAQAYRFAGGGTRYTGLPLPGPDAFDRWCLAIGSDMRYGQSREYVSPGVVGYRDLDTYGDWESADEYGPVWYPRGVATHWAPYRYGHWSWIEPWGWTWVDDAPWGFAPFHYGRWVHVHHRWGWAPGPRHRRACYAPALVAFVQSPHQHAHAPARVGWFPLGPRDVYHPPYAASEDHYVALNESGSGLLGRPALRAAHRQRETAPTHARPYTYRNESVALTLTTPQTFTSGRPVHTHLLRPDAATLRARQTSAHPGIAAPARGTARAYTPGFKSAPAWRAQGSRLSPAAVPGRRDAKPPGAWEAPGRPRHTGVPGAREIQTRKPGVTGPSSAAESRQRTRADASPGHTRETMSARAPHRYSASPGALPARQRNAVVPGAGRRALPLPHAGAQVPGAFPAQPAGPGLRHRPYLPAGAAVRSTPGTRERPPAAPPRTFDQRPQGGERAGHPTLESTAGNDRGRSSRVTGGGFTGGSHRALSRPPRRESGPAHEHGGGGDGER